MLADVSIAALFRHSEPPKRRCISIAGTPLSILSSQISGETPFALSPLVCCAIANTLMKMTASKKVIRRLRDRVSFPDRVSLSVLPERIVCSEAS